VTDSEGEHPGGKHAQENDRKDRKPKRGAEPAQSIDDTHEVHTRRVENEEARECTQAKICTDRAHAISWRATRYSMEAPWICQGAGPFAVGGRVLDRAELDSMFESSAAVHGMGSEEGV